MASRFYSSFFLARFFCVPLAADWYGVTLLINTAFATMHLMLVFSFCFVVLNCWSTTCLFILSPSSYPSLFIPSYSFRFYTIWNYNLLMIVQIMLLCHTIADLGGFKVGAWASTWYFNLKKLVLSIQHSLRTGRVQRCGAPRATASIVRTQGGGIHNRVCMLTCAVLMTSYHSSRFPPQWLGSHGYCFRSKWPM